MPEVTDHSIEAEVHLIPNCGERRFVVESVVTLSPKIVKLLRLDIFNRSLADLKPYHDLGCFVEVVVNCSRKQMFVCRFSSITSRLKK